MGQNFKKLNVYITAKQLVMQVYKLLTNFPKYEQYALCDQIRRAVISIPSNIAEGMGRTSEKEQIHFLEIAYGSLLEVDCQLDIALDLNYITNENYLEVEKNIVEIAKMLSGLRAKRLSSKL